MHHRQAAYQQLNKSGGVTWRKRDRVNRISSHSDGLDRQRNDVLSHLFFFSTSTQLNKAHDALWRCAIVLLRRGITAP